MRREGLTAGAARRALPAIATLGIAALGLATAGGCRTALTSPGAQIPFFDGPGELTASATTGTNTLQLSGAWSPAEHLGVTITGSTWLPSKAINPDYHTFVAATAGWYAGLGEDLRLELMAVASRGWTGEYWSAGGNTVLLPGYDIDSSDTIFSTIRGSYTRYGAQIDFGLARRPRSRHQAGRLDLGLALGVTYIGFDRLERADSVSEGRPAGSGERSLPRRSALFIDPTLLLRGGTDAVDLELQLGTAHTWREVDFSWRAFHIALGVRLHILSGARL